MKGKVIPFMLGILTGAMLFGSAAAVSTGILAEPSRNAVYVDGKQVYMTVYKIAGNNYVKLRDVGKAVGFNVYWEHGVQIETNTPYTGKAPESIELPEEEVPSASLPFTDEDAIRQDIIDRTNELRLSNGLPALKVDPMLMAAAQVRADEMAATSIYSHTRPDGTRRTTVTDCSYTTENIHCISSWRVENPEEDLAKLAVEEWAASKDHRAGMLDSTRGSIGTGIAAGINPTTGEDCWYCVQWFLRKGYSITWVDEPITQK